MGHGKWFTDYGLLNLPVLIKSRKRTMCDFCHKRIRHKESKYKYDSGFNKRGNLGATYWDLHIICYSAVLRLAIKRLEAEIKNEF